MKYENRANPYPFFDELRKAGPVTRVTNDIYVVTGYEEIVALIHDPRISSDLRNRPSAPRAIPVKDGGESNFEADVMEKYGKDPMMIITDPPDHDRARRQAMRHFGPPHSPHVI